MVYKKIVLLISCLFLFSFLAAVKMPLFADVSSNTTASVTIPARASDFQFSFSSLDSPTTFAQNRTLSYQITYGAKTSAGSASTVILVADYSQDTVSGTDVLDYVTSSATNAYNQIQPVIDPVNRTITWTIVAFPQGTTDQTVSFSLKTNANYTGSQTVPFIIKAKMSTQFASLTSLTVSQNYLYLTPASSSPTATPTPGTTSSTTTTTTTAIPTATPTPIQVGQKQSTSINKISITGITDNQISLRTTANSVKQFIISYGLSPTSLTQSIVNVVPDTQTSFNLNTLQTNSAYYFQITTITPDGTKSSSDIYTAKTAQPSTPPTVNSAVAVLTNNNNVIATNVKNQNSQPAGVGIMPVNTPYSVTYTLPQAIDAKTVFLIIRDKHILGISTASQTQETEITIPMTEKAPGVYTADLQALTLGSYQLFVHIADTKGNIIEQNISEIKIIPTIQVLEETTNNPLSDARIYIYYYADNQYIFMPKTYANIKNPSYTGVDGTSTIVLPAGKYKSDISAFGHEKKTIFFTIGALTGQEFPKIYLKKDLYNLAYLLRYFTTTTIDTYTNTIAFLTTFSASYRFFNLAAATIVIVFILLSFLSFSRRAHIPLAYISAYFFHHAKNIISPKHMTTLTGVLVDSDDNPISHAFITVSEGYGNLVIAHGTSDTFGKFYIRTKQIDEYYLTYAKEGFLSKAIVLPSKDLIKNLRVHMVSNDHKNYSKLIISFKYFEDFLSMCFEFFLFGALLLEILFFSLFGLALTLPFFTLSFMNIFLWIFFLRERILQKFFAR